MLSFDSSPVYSDCQIILKVLGCSFKKKKKDSSGSNVILEVFDCKIVRRGVVFKGNMTMQCIWRVDLFRGVGVASELIGKSNEEAR